MSFIRISKARAALPDAAICKNGRRGQITGAVAAKNSTTEAISSGRAIRGHLAHIRFHTDCPVAKRAHFFCQCFSRLGMDQLLLVSPVKPGSVTM